VVAEGVSQQGMNLSTRHMGDLKAPITRVTETIKTLSSHINYKIGDKQVTHGNQTPEFKNYKIYI
jgi:hypothetical protein